MPEIIKILIADDEVHAVFLIRDAQERGISGDLRLTARMPMKRSRGIILIYSNP